MKIDVKKVLAGLFLVMTLGLCLYVFVLGESKDGNVYTLIETGNPRMHIKEEHLKAITMAKKDITESMITNKEDIIGKYIKIAHTIYPGQVLVSESLESLEDSSDSPSLLLKQGQKLLTIKADLLMTGGNTLGENQHVDLVYINKYEEESAKTLFRNIRIVGVKNRNGEDVSSEGVPYVIMLAIRDEFVEEVVTAMEKGSVSLIGVQNILEEECIRGG